MALVQEEHAGCQTLINMPDLKDITLEQEALEAIRKVYGDDQPGAVPQYDNTRTMCMSNIPIMDFPSEYGMDSYEGDDSSGPGGLSKSQSGGRPKKSGARLGAQSAHDIVSGMPGVAEVHELLGTGAFSYVYRCTVEGSDHEVAMKLLTDDLPPEVNNEVNILMELDHPNLVCLLGVLQGPPHGLILELCRGGSLQGLIHNKEVRGKFHQLRPQHWARAVLDVVSAVEYLHENNIMHRDIKSGNCFLSIPAQPGYELPIVKLGDLGFARQQASCMTRGIGTVRYMAPEVISSGTYGLAADIFSCGMLFYEVLIGKVPFVDTCNKANNAGVAVAISTGQRPDLECLRDGGLQETFMNIVDICWSQEPSDRPSSSDLRKNLAEVLAQYQ
eukprot:gnl/TRDRNA2_/TRDRNA2_81066_c0_seq1.p1 gnl/TRDRNA2_/TRDRNA2_81066_c0~~gnl/TRDRNA2_/TRDRNA2_81066_c0_seq1.p1  ORF type:complete len:419 (+),score=83.23 gnl/TRDRNA2_/TRDRNA2_81066_c0_seq1:99-1259(+)